MRKNPRSLRIVNGQAMGYISPDRAKKIVGTDMLLKALSRLPKQQRLDMIEQIKSLASYTDVNQAQVALDRIVANLNAYQATQGLGSAIPAVANVREVIPSMLNTINVADMNKKIEEVKVQSQALSLKEKLSSIFKKPLPAQASSSAVIAHLKNTVKKAEDVVMDYDKEGEGHYATPNHPTPYCADGLNYCADFNFESGDYNDFAIVGADEFSNAQFDDVMQEIVKRRESIRAVIENQPVGNEQKGKLLSLFKKLGDMVKLGKEGKEDQVRAYMTYKYGQDSDETDLIPKDFETVDDFNDSEEVVFKEYEEEVEIVASNNTPVSASEIEAPVKVGNIEVKPIREGALRDFFKNLFNR